MHQTKKIVNKKRTKKKYDFINFICFRLYKYLGKKYIKNKDGVFWIKDEVWIKVPLPEIAKAIGCTAQNISQKVIRPMVERGEIDYEYKDLHRKSHGGRDHKSLHFTAKGYIEHMKPFIEKQKQKEAIEKIQGKDSQSQGGSPKEEKKVYANKAQADIRNDNLNKLTSGEVVFKKHNDSKGALGVNLLLKNGIYVPIEQQTFCFIVKLCSILAQGLSTEIAIQRLREYINWLILRLNTVKHEDVFSLRNVFKFYFGARKRWQAEEREARLLEEHSERRLLDDRKREYQWLPSSKAMNSIGNVVQNLMEKLSPPQLAVSMRMQT